MRNPFRRRDNQTIAELESYYATQGKSRGRGRAWLMAFISLIITVIVIVGLFFAVRWAYRAMTDDSSDTITTGTVEGDGGATIITDGSGDPRSSEDIVAGVLNPDSDDADDAGTVDTEEGGVVSDEAASTTREVAGDTSTDSDNTLTTTGPSDLPSTGAGETVAIILLATVGIGYAMSRRFQIR